MHLRHPGAATPNTRLGAGVRVLVTAAVAVLLVVGTVGFASTVTAAPSGAVSVTSDQTTEPPADGNAPAPGPDATEPDEPAAGQPVADELAVEEPSADDPTSGTDPAPTEPEQTDTEPVPDEEETGTAERAQLSLQASMSPEVVSQDEIVTISVVVSNNGSTADTNVRVSNLLPAGAVFRSATDVAFNEQSAEASVGTVDADESKSFAIAVVFPKEVGEMVSTPSVQGTGSSDEASSVVVVLPTVPGGPVSPDPSPAPSTSPDDTEGSGSGSDGGGPTDSAPTTAGGSTSNGGTTNGGTSDAGSGQGGSLSGGSSPGDTAPGGGGPSGSTPNGSGQSGAGQSGSGGTGSGPDGPGRDGPGRSGSGNAGGDARSGGDRSAQPAQPEASGVQASSSAGGSTVVTDPGADQIGPAWGQSAVHMLGIALVVTGCVLLAVGGVRRNRFWS